MLTVVKTPQNVATIGIHKSFVKNKEKSARIYKMKNVRLVNSEKLAPKFTALSTSGVFHNILYRKTFLMVQNFTEMPPKQFFALLF